MTKKTERKPVYGIWVQRIKTDQPNRLYFRTVIGEFSKEKLEKSRGKKFFVTNHALQKIIEKDMPLYKSFFNRKLGEIYIDVNRQERLMTYYHFYPFGESKENFLKFEKFRSVGIGSFILYSSAIHLGKKFPDFKVKYPSGKLSTDLAGNMLKRIGLQGRNYDFKTFIKKIGDYIALETRRKRIERIGKPMRTSFHLPNPASKKVKRRA